MAVSPANDAAEKKATKRFVESLKWAGKNGFPVILGQYRNARDKAVYSEAHWGFISVFGVSVFSRKRGGRLRTLSLMGLTNAALIVALAFTPVLFGLANFFFAGLVFSALSVWKMKSGKLP